MRHAGSCVPVCLYAALYTLVDLMVITMRFHCRSDLNVEQNEMVGTIPSGIIALLRLTCVPLRRVIVLFAAVEMSLSIAPLELPSSGIVVVCSSPGT